MESPRGQRARSGEVAGSRGTCRDGRGRSARRVARVDQQIEQSLTRSLVAPPKIYGGLLTRVTAAKLTHGIRGVIWHQGENDSGSGAPTGDWNYKSYQQDFVDMSAAWKEDLSNI